MSETIRELIGTAATVLAAVVGTVVAFAGLVMTQTSWQDARKDQERARRTTAIGDTLESLGGIPDEVVKILPDLVKTAAGIAIAVLLLGVVLLLGAVAGTTGGVPLPSPPPS